MNRSVSCDASYKALFSCPELVRDLLRGYVPGKWLEHADFGTLTRVNASYVSRSNKQRHDDMVWRIDIGGQWLWVYILLEFQSESDPWMAVRIMQYVSLLAEQIIKERGQDELPEGKLPPILPIVLYNGRAAWSAPNDAADCFHPPPDGLQSYRPSLHYLLLDERRLQQHPLREVRNFADAVFRMEASQKLEDVLEVVRALAELLDTPELQSVRLAFNQWIKSLLDRRSTSSMMKEIGNTQDVFKEFEMLTQHKETWFDDAIMQGWVKGREEGRAKGREEGREEERLSIARNLLGLGRPVEEIARVTGLEPEKIKSLTH